MLHIELDPNHRWAILKPDGPLKQSDFEAAARQIDPIITEHGKLNGLIIYTEKFPGWDSFAALSSHLKFVKQHHRNIRRIAIVTDSALGDVAETLVSHFVAAEIKHFPFASLAEAKDVDARQVIFNDRAAVGQQLESIFNSMRRLDVYTRAI